MLRDGTVDIDSILKSTTVRFLAVGTLIVGLMLPLLFVFLLMSDRENYYQQAQESIGEAWGLPQTVTGPVLLYKGTERRFNHLQTPIQLDVNLTSDYEIRRRGIFEVPVFTSEIQISGSFGSDVHSRIPKAFRGDPNVAFLFLVISDTRGVRRASAEYRGEIRQFQSTRDPNGVNGIELPIRSEDLAETTSFKISIELRFTGRVGFVLTGNESILTVSSTWPHPSFDGRFLPDERTVRKDGFVASWSATALSRGFPSVLGIDQWESVLWSEPRLTRFVRSERDEGISETAYSVGFSVVDPVTPYRLTLRALKYGVMFIALTLVSVLCIELIMKRRFHIVQYGVVGAGLAIFYLVLLALSEIAVFAAAYVVAASFLTIMISAYSWFIHRDPRVATTFLAVLTLLYAVMYIVLWMQDYALVVGSSLSLLLLAMLMYATRSLHVSEK